MFISIAQQWLDHHQLTTNQALIPQDSPNRSVRRAVIQDQTDGQLYVLEAVGPDKKARRIRQADVLQTLKDNGCQTLTPWLRTPQQTWGLEQDGLFWQLRHFAQGVELPRETYGNHSWRGTQLATFLAQLRQMPPTITQGLPVFSLHDYVCSLIPKIRQKMPPLAQDLLPIWEETHDFAHHERTLDIIPAHGDFHPNNAIWGQDDIQAVIDWEFFGPKAEGYDAANLLGCLGMDDPAFLTGPMAMAFIRELKQQGALSEQALYWLPDFIVALRFGWMREWVWNREPRELIIQELDFMWLVLDNRDLLRKKWAQA